MFDWQSMNGATRVGIMVAVVVFILLIIIGIRSEWKFKCFQRVPLSGQTWEQAVKT